MGTGVSLSSLVPLEYLSVFSLVAPEDYDRNPSKYAREKVEEGGDTEDASMTWIRSTRSALMQHIYFRRAVYQKYSSRLDSTGTVVILQLCSAFTICILPFRFLFLCRQA